MFSRRADLTCFLSTVTIPVKPKKKLKVASWTLFCPRATMPSHI